MAEDSGNAEGSISQNANPMESPTWCVYSSSSMRPLCLALFLLASAAAGAAPVITVKGRALLRVVGIHRTSEGVRIDGEFQDADLSSGVPNRRVQLTVAAGGEQHRLTVSTDEQGQFSVTLPGSASAYRVAAQFAGDKEYAAETQEPQLLDVTKQTLDLQLSADSELDAGLPEQPINIRTRVGTDPVSVPLSLRTARGEVHVATDAEGNAALRIRTETLGEPGTAVVTATFAGDGRINATTVRHHLLLTTRVRLTLWAKDAAVNADGEIQLQGEAADHLGPVAAGAVSLEVMGQPGAATLTDRQGRFSFQLAAEDFPPGTLDLSARYSPSESWRRPAVSPTIQVAIVPPKPIPARLYLVPALLTAAILLALSLVRFWPSIRGRLRHASEAPRFPVEVSGPIPSGVHRSRTGRRSLMRHAFDITGTVWDPTDKRPLAAASVLVERPGEGSTRVVTSRDGTFRLPQLAAGTHHVTVSLPGHVRESFSVQIPHRGNLHDLRVDLIQVRVRLLELYQQAALPLLPDRSFWACWTPRELAHHAAARAGVRHPPLEQLTALLEQAYWSGVLGEEELLQTARRLRDEMVSR